MHGSPDWLSERPAAVCPSVQGQNCPSHGRPRPAKPYGDPAHRSISDAWPAWPRRLLAPAL